MNGADELLVCVHVCVQLGVDDECVDGQQGLHYIVWSCREMKIKRESETERVRVRLLLGL